MKQKHIHEQQQFFPEVIKQKRCHYERECYETFSGDEKQRVVKYKKSIMYCKMKV